ncbi:MAG TPA: hypothetical protein V6D20_19090 [Candidatus Obscuribacterales bacterium]
MFGIFAGATSGTGIRISEFPFDHGLANATVFRGMFGDISASIEAKLFHVGFADIPVDVGYLGWVESCMVSPVLDGLGVFNQLMERICVGQNDLGGALPKLPSFILDCMLGCCSYGRREVVPVCFGCAVHLDIQLLFTRE